MKKPSKLLVKELRANGLFPGVFFSVKESLAIFVPRPEVIFDRGVVNEIEISVVPVIKCSLAGCCTAFVFEARRRLAEFQDEVFGVGSGLRLSVSFEGSSVLSVVCTCIFPSKSCSSPDGIMCWVSDGLLYSITYVVGFQRGIRTGGRWSVAIEPI